MKYFARVTVTLKEDIRDPQGEAIKKTLHHKGFLFIDDVRVGKYITILLEASSKSEALENIKKICSQVLHNPVIENFSIEISEANDYPS